MLQEQGENMHIFSKNKVNTHIFLLEKTLRKLSLDRLFSQKSKVHEDMIEMIDKMKG